MLLYYDYRHKRRCVLYYQASCDDLTIHMYIYIDIFFYICLDILLFLGSHRGRSVLAVFRYFCQSFFSRYFHTFIYIISRHTLYSVSSSPIWSVSVFHSFLLGLPQKTQISSQNKTYYEHITSLSFSQYIYIIHILYRDHYQLYVLTSLLSFFFMRRILA